MTKTEKRPPRWARKAVRASELRFRKDNLARLQGVFDWERARDFLITELQSVVDAVSQYPEHVYEYVVLCHEQWAPPVRQVLLISRRKQRIPTSSSKYPEQEFGPSLPGSMQLFEDERPAYLVFSHEDDGSLVVHGHPHSSTQGSLIDIDAPVLLKVPNAADMHTTLGSWRIRKAIRNFLFLDQLSAFGRKPRFWDARRLREIYATHSRLTPLWSSWKERRVENHKLDVSFGTSLVAGLGVSFIVQEIYDVMHPDKVDGGIVWLYLCLAFFTFVLRRQFNRR